MKYESLENFISTGQSALVKGPVALVFVEDDVEVATTLRHHLDCGFASVIVFMPDAFALPDDLQGKVHRVSYDMFVPNALEHAINTLIEAGPGLWFYYCFNAEYLFFPFCETRSVG